MAIALVQGKAAAGGGTTTLTFNSATTAGNLNVVCTQSNNGNSNAISGITDTATNTYAKAVSVRNVPNDQSVEIWYAKNTTGNAANQVSVTFGTPGDYHALHIGEFSGCDTTAPLDTNQGSATGNSTTAATGSFNITSGDLVVAIACMAGFNPVHGTGFTDMVASPDAVSLAEYQVVAATSIDAQETGSSGQWGIAGAAFKAAGGGGASVTYPQLERGTRGLGRGLVTGVFHSPVAFKRRDRIFVPAWLGKAA